MTTFNNPDVQEFYELTASEPSVVVERIKWLLDGNYGEHLYNMAKDVLNRPRMNHNAWLFNTIGTAEFNCTNAQSSSVYNKLTPTQQQILNTLITSMVTDLRVEQESHTA